MNLIEAEVLIQQEMTRHTMHFLGWRFEWDNAARRFGQCDFGMRVIRMSRVLTELNSREDVRDTILHEIAHALVGPQHDHDVFWQIQARKIGAKPIKCYGAEIVEPTPKYIGACVSCGKEVKRYKLTRRVKQECFHTACLKAGKEAKMTWRKL